MAFEKCSPFREWKGRYGRIPGKATCFYIKHDGHDWWPCINMTDDDNSAICWINKSETAKYLRDAVNEAKYRLNGQPGGSFLIDEYGKTIVPSVNSGRLLVGDVKETLVFRNPVTGADLTLRNDENLQTGDEWKKPYVGNVHSLNANGNKIYAVKTIAGSQIAEYPEKQDSNLISKLNKIKKGGGRFIVNHEGVVITKIQYAEKFWKPVFVGNINPALWFIKE
jgi:hypothetical protein